MKSDSLTLRPIELREASTTPVSWGRLAYGAAGILALAGLFTTLCDTPMIWDGAYQFCYSLRTHEPYKYLTRFHSYILWTPMVWLSHVTHNLTVLKWAYGLPFTLAPAASVLLSWLVVRRKAPHLIVWAVFGAAAAPLPGQIFIINDSIFQQHMFWPVFLGLLVPLTWLQMIGLAVLVIFQFSHQIGLLLLTGGCGAAAVMAWRDREDRTQFLIKSAVCLILAIVALWKIIHYPDSYAQREFTWARASEAWKWGVAGYPIRGLTLMWVAGVCVLAHRLLAPARWGAQRQALRWIAIGCVALAAGTWIFWAGAQDGRLWADALNYRRWVVPLTVPFYLLALVDAWVVPFRAEVSRQEHRARVWIAYCVAATFALVLSVQSVVWVRLVGRIVENVEGHAGVIVPFADVGWMAGTPADHWGTASYIYVLEGNQPRHVLLDHWPQEQRDQLKILDEGRVPLSPFTPVDPEPGVGGFLDFKPMMRALVADTRENDVGRAMPAK